MAALILGSSFSAFAASRQLGNELYSKGPGAVNVKELSQKQSSQEESTVDVNRFQLPQDAKVLVVVEGTGGSGCNVYAYEKVDGAWVLQISCAGYLGLNGMSNDRTTGDKTTPIGVFQMDTPFGQDAPLAGFPANYIQVDESYMWEDDTNVLSRDLTKCGEQVGTAGYKEHYDYVINLGYNKNAVKDKGSALFLHCKSKDSTSSSGCVAVDKDQMVGIMKLYGKYGDGHCYSALAPAGTFDLIYDSYGTNNGLSPSGDFKN